MRTKLFVFTFLVLFSFIDLEAQVIGKIFDANYANEEFGQVVNFTEINSNELINLINNADEYIMLNIESGIIRALDSKRNSIQGSAVSNEEVFYKMSISQVNLLIKKGSEETTIIEMRPKTMTLTNGSYTLEMIKPCPPNCN